MDNKTIQGSAEWLEERKKHIGASDIAIINGTSPFKGSYTLWLEKTDRKEPEPSNSAMEYGKRTEPIARERYIKTSGYFVLPSVQYYEPWDIAMASLDGKTEDEKLICEIKCPMSSKLYDNALDLKIPDYYHDQMQWQLMVTKADRCDYFVYVSEIESVTIPVYPDPEYHKELLEKAKAFWKHVEDDTPPERKSDEPEYVESSLSNELANEWRKSKEMEEDAKERRQMIEKDLKALHSKGKFYFTEANVKMNEIERKGSIDWNKLAKDYGITEEDTEKYRKKSLTYVSFTVVKR
jgi:putative phage-type endonuclease